MYLEQNMNKQCVRRGCSDNNYSINHQSIVDGHRELFLGLLHQPQLLRKFASANAIDVDEWELRIVSAFFVNHRSYALTVKRNYGQAKVDAVTFSRINCRMTGTKSCLDIS